MIAPVSMLVIGRLPDALPVLVQPETPSAAIVSNATYCFMPPPE